MLLCLHIFAINNNSGCFHCSLGRVDEINFFHRTLYIVFHFQARKVQKKVKRRKRRNKRFYTDFVFLYVCIVVQPIPSGIVWYSNTDDFCFVASHSGGNFDYFLTHCLFLCHKLHHIYTHNLTHDELRKSLCYNYTVNRNLYIFPH